MRRRVLTALTGCALVALLAACTGLPVTGPVTAGLAVDEAPTGPEVRFVPDAPQLGATPEEIVDGFLRAGSGTSGDWAIARSFLAPSIRETWDPSAGVAIVPTGEVIAAQFSGTTASLSLEPIATVDAAGRYQAGDEGFAPLAFELVQIDGQWRISRAPDGIVLDESVFLTVFHQYSVMYFDPSWTYLVPDVRWFPTTNAAVRITSALVDAQASDWLRPAVSSAFPEDVTFAWSSVPVSAGTARVELSPEVLASDAVTLARMVAQLDASLATAGISKVELTVDGTPISAVAAPVRSTAVTAGPLVLTADGFGFLSGTELTRIPGLSGAVEVSKPTAIQVSADRTVAALRTADGVVRAEDSGVAPIVDERDELLNPTIDPRGYVWSVPGSSPAALSAFGSSGQELSALAQAWVTAGATRVESIAMSRDGTRLAAVVGVGSRREIWVSGVVRGTGSADGAPVRIGEPWTLGALPGPTVAMSWSDDATLALVVSVDGESTIVQQPVGGPISVLDGPAGASIDSVATAASSLRLHSSAGGLYLRRGANWLQTAAEITVLAVQQGAP